MWYPIYCTMNSDCLFNDLNWPWWSVVDIDSFGVYELLYKIDKSTSDVHALGFL